MKDGNSAKIVHRGRVFNVEAMDVRATDGTTRRYEVVRHPGAVVIVPVLDGDRLVLIENRRIAIGSTLIELPAGTLDAGEDPADAAARELAEETGYRAERMRAIGSFYSSPGFCDERLHAFVADGLTAGETAREADEEISTKILDAGAVLEMIDSGRIRDAKTIAAVLLWDRLERAEVAR